jgi:hypothetical protein
MMKQRKDQSFATTFVFLLIKLALQSHGSDASSQQILKSSTSILQFPRTPEELQTALNTASDGDTINLLPISYTGDFILHSRNPDDKIVIRGSAQLAIDEEPIPVKEVKPWFRLATVFRTPKTVPVPRKYSKNHTRIIGKEAAFKLITGDWTITTLSIESGGIAAKYNGETVPVLCVPTRSVYLDFRQKMKDIAHNGDVARILTRTKLFHANNGSATKLKLMGMTWNETEFWDSNKEGMSREEYLRNFNLIVPTGHEGE